MRQVFYISLCLTAFGCPLLARSSADTASTRFPRLAGWEFKEEQTVYSRDNLWELIDGAADLFVSYEFENLYVAEYRSPDAVDVRVELYRHASGEMAFGMYAAERSPEFSFVSLGTQGYIEDGLLNFLVGKCYVKISSYSAGKAGRDAMVTVGGALQKHLAEKTGWPDVLSLFPPQGRLSNSEGMTASNFLGYSFFTSAYTCRYDSSHGAQAFIIECATGAEAARLLSKYTRLSGKNTAEGTEGTVVVNDPNLGNVGIVKRGRFLGGVLPPSGAALPGDLLKQLDMTLAARVSRK
jgi:hypothetical protein